MSIAAVILTVALDIIVLVLISVRVSSVVGYVGQSFHLLVADVCQAICVLSVILKNEKKTVQKTVLK